MKKIMFIAIMLINTASFSQSLSVFDVDTSNFPIMKAKFYALDKDGKQIIPNINDLSLTENGVTRKILKINNSTLNEPQPISLTFGIDRSFTMNYWVYRGTPMELAKSTIKSIISFIQASESEIALQSCGDFASINQDFTQDKDKLYFKLNQISVGGDPNIVDFLNNPLTGLFNVTKKGKNSRIAIIVTDIIWYYIPPNILKECIDTCKKYNIKIFAINLNNMDPILNEFISPLKKLVDSTGGEVYNGIVSKEDSYELAMKLQGDLQDLEPCEIEWQSGIKW